MAVHAAAVVVDGDDVAVVGVAEYEGTVSRELVPGVGEPYIGGDAGSVEETPTSLVLYGGAIALVEVNGGILETTGVETKPDGGADEIALLLGIEDGVVPGGTPFIDEEVVGMIGPNDDVELPGTGDTT